MTEGLQPSLPPQDGMRAVRDFARCAKCGRGFAAGTLLCSLDGSALVPSRGATMIGEVLGGRYLVEQLMGAGGMGEVYKARHTALGRTVALKVIRPDLAGTPTAVALLTREARNASRVEHPNAVRIFDIETHGAFVFLAMEYAPGPNLADVVDASGPPAPALVGQIVSQVALGLEAIHSAGIVHRDLKPSNVVLTRAGGRGLVKLLDFGIARAFGEPDQALTATGLTVGTPGFMSPEQRAGIPLDSRADVFSLAVVTVYLLAGRLPHLSPISILRLTDVPESSGWPEPMRAALLQALQLEPNHRPSTATHFARLIQEAVARWSAPPSRPDTIESELQQPRWSHAELQSVGHLTPVGTSAVPQPSQTTEKVAPLPMPDAPPPVVRGPRVESVSGPLLGQAWAMGQNSLHVGRDSRHCEVAFPPDATFVSRIHASIQWDLLRRCFILQDEGSSNFTFLEDGRRLEAGVAVDLPPGATFSVGSMGYRFRVRND